jgi:thiosulfate/3-mercaptopyruvate sulfurtransferase
MDIKEEGMKRRTEIWKVVFVAMFLIFIGSNSVMAVENGGYVNQGFLVTTQWLQDNVNRPDIRILDRQDIEEKDAYYSKAHIPNSIRMPTSAIKGMKVDIQEMLVLKDLVNFLEENGVSAKDHIILVGRSERLPATTRVFWALEILGHGNISILDGGIDKWLAEKRPLTTEIRNFPKTTYEIRSLQRERLMTGVELEGYIGLMDRFKLVVVDSRRPDEFAGKEMSRDSDKLGHIPGAINLMFMQLLTGKDYKEFKSAEEIRTIFKAKGLTPDKHLTFTCVSGCFGTVDYFAARLMGYQDVSVYDGAWIEWCRRGYPIELGSGIQVQTPQPAASPQPAKKKSSGAPREGC